jgi:hypothetical protein
MGQFKPMVKMETTEPSVILKLKKGGSATRERLMKDGAESGFSPMARPMARPMPPAPMARPAMGRPMMKKGGSAETPAMHKAEMKAIKGVDEKLSKHADKPASKAHKGLKTGGVVMGQGGFKKGGAACYAKGGGVEGNVSSAKPGVTGTSTGDVRKSNAGGYMKGGAAKKAYATGGAVDTGRPVAMPKKPPSTPVSINQLSGTFKKGGKVC